MPFVLSQAAQAATNSTGRILVVFEWFGGNDGLNTIVPYGDPIYYKHRPTIGLRENGSPEDRRALRLAQVDGRH
ncbi:MAG: hypothetical protein QM736_20960 [Vicinamibacterales bacterium]